MHPLYLVDYICRIKRDLNNDVEYLRGGIDGIRAIETKFNELELNWLMTAVEREAHLLKHHIFQLEKYLEKITANDSKQ